MKIATTIGEVKGYTSTPAEAVKMYEGTGFRHLDYNFYDVLKEGDPFMADGWQEMILEAKEAAQALNMDFVQAHAPNCKICGGDTQREILATQRSIEACGMLGIKNMVIHSGFLTGFTYPDDMPAYCRANEPFFRALIPAMEKHGVSILFENTTEKHCRGGRFFPIYARDLNEMIAFMDHPLFDAAWDVGHANMDDIDHAAEIMEMGKNLRAIHVHDNFGDKDIHLAPFEGTMDFDNLMRGLIDSGFAGYFTLEATRFFPYKRKTELTGKLAHPSKEVKKAALRLMYLTCKDILSAYGVYED